MAGYNFTESPRTYTNVTTSMASQNFTAFQPRISGSIGMLYVTITVSGVQSSVFWTESYGVTVPYGWSGTVSASFAGYGFIESPRTYTNVTANLYHQDFTPFRPHVSGYVKNCAVKCGDFGRNGHGKRIRINNNQFEWVLFIVCALQLERNDYPLKNRVWL